MLFPVGERNLYILPFVYTNRRTIESPSNRVAQTRRATSNCQCLVALRLEVPADVVLPGEARSTRRQRSCPRRNRGPGAEGGPQDPHGNAQHVGTQEANDLKGQTLKNQTLKNLIFMTLRKRSKNKKSQSLKNKSARFSPASAGQRSLERAGLPFPLGAGPWSWRGPRALRTRPRWGTRLTRSLVRSRGPEAAKM